MTLNTEDLNKIYKSSLGKEVDAGGQKFWSDHYAKVKAAHKSQGKSDEEAASLALANVTTSVQSHAPKPKKEEPKVEAKAKEVEKSWQKGYDSTGAGNFESMSTVMTDAGSKKSFEDQITAIFEQKGLTADQVKTGKYIEKAYGHKTVADAFRDAAKQTGTAQERGNVWGTGVGEGKHYLTSIGSDPTGHAAKEANAKKSLKTAEDLVSKLYTQGFGREPDPNGLREWSKALNQGKASYSQIANAFLGSEEAQIRDLYTKNFGRDADDGGMQFWLSQSKHKGGALAAATAFIEGSDNKEGQIRDLYATHLGQHSKAADRNLNFWTDAQEAGYEDRDWSKYTGALDAAGHFTGYGAVQGTTAAASGVEEFRQKLEKSARGEAGGLTLGEIKAQLEHREKLMNLSSTYNRDDDKGGTGIGDIFTLDEISQKYGLDKFEDDTKYSDIGNELGAETWNILTTELKKKFKTETEPEYIKDKEGNPISITNPKYPQFDPKFKTKSKNTLHSDFDVPIPKDKGDPLKATVNTTDVDYMTKKGGLDPTGTLSRTTYDAAKIAKASGTPQMSMSKSNQFMASQSAQGVARKRSAAFRSGASATGTKQLQRKDNMKIQSLNL